MDVEQVFRWSFVAIFIASAAISIYHRRRARASGEPISRREEGKLAILLRAIFALPVILSFFAYMLNPKWMAWSIVPLPLMLRGHAPESLSRRHQGQDWQDGAATQAGIATREAVSLGSSASFGYDCGVKFDTWEMSAER